MLDQLNGKHRTLPVHLQLPVDSKSSAGKTRSKYQFFFTAGSKKKKRRSGREKERSASPQEIPIDPDEPTYCLCDQVSYFLARVIVCSY